MKSSFRPVTPQALTAGVLLCDSLTSEIWEILCADDLSLKMKSVNRNCIIIMPASELKPDKWVICEGK